MMLRCPSGTTHYRVKEFRNKLRTKFIESTYAREQMGTYIFGSNMSSRLELACHCKLMGNVIMMVTRQGYRIPSGLIKMRECINDCCSTSKKKKQKKTLRRAFCKVLLPFSIQCTFLRLRVWCVCFDGFLTWPQAACSKSWEDWKELPSPASPN